MESASIIIQQILTMFLYMGAGYVLFKKELVSKAASASFANTLIYLILPCAILQSFFTARTPEKVTALWLSMVWGVVILILSILIAALLFRKHPIENFGAAFSNAGFMGLPLITAILGPESVFYAAGMIAFLNIFQWFYGQRILSGRHTKLSIAAILKNPLVVSLLLGLFFFFTSIQPPAFVMRCISSVAGLNGPMAMIILGFYLAQTNLASLFGKLSTYWVSVIRLFAIPIATLAFLAVVPGVPADIKLALLLAASAPIGANVAVYAQKVGKDYVYAVETVCLSTLFSICSIPLIIVLAEKIFA